jgi:collagenase-like PrtC family protease
MTATAESIEQAKKLLLVGVDRLYIGDETFALRVPSALSKDEIAEITALAHAAGKTVTVAVNALMHVEKMALIRPYLDFLQSIKVDRISVGDAGVVYILQTEGYALPYSYDASTMVASARQVNFWAQQGAVEAVLARELPKIELSEMAKELEIPGELLLYGATVIHHSKRPLLQNYFNFIQNDSAQKDQAHYHFIAEPSDNDSHYSIFEDSHGTHIFANDDLDMLPAFSELTEMGYTHFKLDGIFTRGDAFVEIAKSFIEAKNEIASGAVSADKLAELDTHVRALHPENRTLSRGFYDIDPETIK